MTNPPPTIDEALALFLAEQRARLAPRMCRQYESIVDLLTHSLNGYAYDSLEPSERRRWSAAFDAGDEQAFTKLFGPDKIAGHLGEFLGYYMIRKVFGSVELTRAAGTVTKRLAEWLGERGWLDATAVDEATERAADAARDLPRARRLGELLFRQADRTRIAPDALADDDYVEDYLTIERVGPSALWFEDGIGPVPVSAEASKLAQPGWSINIVLGRKGGRWHVLEVGNVYP